MQPSGFSGALLRVLVDHCRFLTMRTAPRITLKRTRDYRWRLRA